VAASQLLLKGEQKKRGQKTQKQVKKPKYKTIKLRNTHLEQGYGFKSEVEYVPAAHWQEQRRVQDWESAVQVCVPPVG
jgi:hypothetical protein